MPPKALIGPTARSVKQPDISAIKNARNARVLAIYSWGWELKKRLFKPPPECTDQFIRHAERSGQRRNSSVAHAVVLSVWHVVQGLGILYLSVIAGVINANVCARTFTSAMVVSIFGI